MNETEFIDVMNLARVTMVIGLLKLVTPVNKGDEYYNNEVALMILTLNHWKNELQERIKTVEG
jgi:hypothetical protein